MCDVGMLVPGSGTRWDKHGLPSPSSEATLPALLKGGSLGNAAGCEAHGRAGGWGTTLLRQRPCPLPRGRSIRRQPPSQKERWRSRKKRGKAGAEAQHQRMGAVPALPELRGLEKHPPARLLLGKKNATKFSRKIKCNHIRAGGKAGQRGERADTSPSTMLERRPGPAWGQLCLQAPIVSFFSFWFPPPQCYSSE